MNACTCAVRPPAWVATFWLVQTSLFSRQTYRLIIQDFAGHHELMSADLGNGERLETQQGEVRPKAD